MAMVCKTLHDWHIFVDDYITTHTFHVPAIKRTLPTNKLTINYSTVRA